MDPEFEQKLIQLRRKDRRYTIEAYLFLFESLEFTIQQLGKQSSTGIERHINGKELLMGFRDLARQQFGPLSRYVLAQWGIHSTEDVGEIVFLLVDAGLLKKRECDTKLDFQRGYDFREAFDKNYTIDLSSERG